MTANDETTTSTTTEVTTAKGNGLDTVINALFKLRNQLLYSTIIAQYSGSSQCDSDESEHEITICENKKKEINCGDNKKIRINKVNYGHLDKTTCQYATENTATSNQSADTGSTTPTNAVGNSVSNSGAAVGSNAAAAGRRKRNSATDTETATAATGGSGYTQCKGENSTEKVKET